jgi:curli biogenesis system outer membrane secretion channel CsgG
MIKMNRLSLIAISVAFLIFSGCTSHYVTTFTPEQKPTRQLDMNYQGPRANIAVGDFTVKARGATKYIGDGLREMLATALFESQRFNVLDRMDPQGLTAEQKLSYSKMAKSGSPRLGAQMEVAELMMYGTVTEFEAEASGAGVKVDVPTTWNKASVHSGTGGLKGKNAHMAIDVRIVDTASGRLVAARRIAGSAASFKATIGLDVNHILSTGGNKHRVRTPASLGMFKNTSMELAIRDCIYRSVIYSTQAVPPQYFRH